MIVSLIRGIIEELPVEEDGSVYPIFLHGEKEIQNAISDEIDLEAKEAAVYLDEPIRSNDNITKGGYIEETYPIEMLFVKKSQLDWTPEQHQVVILEMRDLRRRFLNRLASNSNVRSVSGVTTIDIKNIFNVNLSGVILRLTVVPFNSNSAC
jgi:hypothetical protein